MTDGDYGGGWASWAGSNNRYGESGTLVSVAHVNLPILLHLRLILVSLDVRPGRTKPVISNLEIPELVLGFPHLSSPHSESQSPVGQLLPHTGPGRGEERR